MMKKYCVSLDDVTVVKRFREVARRQVARRRAFLLDQDVKWQDLLRIAAAQFLASESISEVAEATSQKGTR